MSGFGEGRGEGKREVGKYQFDSCFPNTISQGKLHPFMMLPVLFPGNFFLTPGNFYY